MEVRLKTKPTCDICPEQWAQVTIFSGENPITLYFIPLKHCNNYMYQTLYHQ